MMDSKLIAYNIHTESYVPKWRLEVKGDGRDREYSLYYYSEKKMSYRIVNIRDKYASAHLRYLQDNHPERIRKYLDNGKLYVYLMRLARSAYDVVYDQVDKWTKTDREYLIAHESGDIRMEAGLLNNFIHRAEELMFPAVIYV